jgi:secreted protein with Ig-like and vWFA domain
MATEADILLQQSQLNPADRAALMAEQAAAAAQTTVIPAGAALTRGAPSPMELAVRAKLKAGQDAKLQKLLRARGVGAAAPVNEPAISVNPNILQ